MERLSAQALQLCSERAFKAVVVDLSAIDLIDLTEWRWLRGLSGGVSLMGSSAWFVGLRPSVISALMMMNAPIEGMSFAMGVEEALQLSRAT
jgi:rsbT antagonist protein RsbS